MEFDFSDNLKRSMELTKALLTTARGELEDERLLDLHFTVGNDWKDSRGTPARTPFAHLVRKARIYHSRYQWYGKPLEIRTLSQMEIINGA